MAVVGAVVEGGIVIIVHPTSRINQIEDLLYSSGVHPPVGL